jgi:TRAP-type C4-dicarboxylate transport system permease small subunit
MKALGSIDRILFRIELALLTMVLASMVGLASLQILLRNLFSTGITSADIVLRHLTLGLTFLGASLATREGRHLKIDIVPRIVSKRMKGLLGAITGILSVAVCIILARAGWNFVLLEQQSQSVFALGIPLWVVKLVIPLGFLQIAFRILLRMVYRAPEGGGHDRA